MKGENNNVVFIPFEKTKEGKAKKKSESYSRWSKFAIGFFTCFCNDVKEEDDAYNDDDDDEFKTLKNLNIIKFSMCRLIMTTITSVPS